MKTIENEVLQLAEDIYVGRYSYEKAEKRIQSLEQKYGSLERNIEYPDYPDLLTKDYLDDLIYRVRVGLYSKELLLDMAKAADIVSAAKRQKNKALKPIMVAFAIVAIAILVVIVATSLGE